LAHGFSPWLFGSIAFGTVVRQKIMAEIGGRGSLLTSQWLGRKKRESLESARGSNILFKGTPTMT
jgi:hypothetical protein